MDYSSEKGGGKGLEVEGRKPSLSKEEKREGGGGV